MLTLQTGNILESDADALVNTVNCEGFMGKGLAYQFKKMFPETNKSYIDTCKKNELKPGLLHSHYENNKLVINFPTKDKWRQKSKIEYIEDGMKTLLDLIYKENIKSIAIPPLGSGNGGLSWEDVKKIILNYTDKLNDDIDVFIYEPSFNYQTKAKVAPKLTLSHFILMNIKSKLSKFSKFRLQKAAFFINLYSHQNYFKFDAHHYGPFSHSIDIISRDIKEFQEFHKFSTEEALNYAYKTLISEKVEEELENFLEPLTKATNFINQFSSNEKIELYSTICYILVNNDSLLEEEIITKIHSWSQMKQDKFNKNQISNALEELVSKKIIQLNILGEFKLIL